MSPYCANESVVLGSLKIKASEAVQRQSGAWKYANVWNIIIFLDLGIPLTRHHFRRELLQMYCFSPCPTDFYQRAVNLASHFAKF